MDPRVLYWTAAWLNMAFVTALALTGVAAIRSGRIETHRARMITAAVLVALFLVSYPVKVILLGREDLASWPSREVAILRFHEVCVALMVLGGSAALVLARSLRLRAAPEEARAGRPRLVALHRWAGRLAVSATVLGLLSAGAILAGMWGRAG